MRNKYDFDILMEAYEKLLQEGKIKINDVFINNTNFLVLDGKHFIWSLLEEEISSIIKNKRNNKIDLILKLCVS